jgi:hypothetical protein
MRIEDRRNRSLSPHSRNILAAPHRTVIWLLDIGWHYATGHVPMDGWRGRVQVHTYT